MEPQEAIDMGREAIFTALLVGSPLLVIGVVVGLTIGLIQALTQIQDQTISFVPKIVAMVMALSLCLPWLVQKMLEYSEGLIMNIPNVIMGG
jgi:flagellar biosynthetic protein FliQ